LRANSGSSLAAMLKLVALWAGCCCQYKGAIGGSGDQEL
jgi:hypothetical protein